MATTSQLIVSDCLYHMLASLPHKVERYAVTIIEINSPKRESRGYNQHLEGKSNDDVEIVRFMRTKNLTKFPRGIKKIFPNVQVLIVNDCKISELDLEDLNELTELIVQHTPIKILTLESVKNLKNLEILTIHDTKLSFIDEKIFDNLKNLKEIFLTENPAINVVYSSINDQKFPNASKIPSIDELKRVIRGCSSCDSVCLDLKKLLACDQFKDFTVTVKESCYHGLDCNEKCCNEIIKVHKFLLIARSPVLAEMIEKNSDARNLNLIDIPAYAFKKLIEYFYNGILPSFEGDAYLKLKDLFAVADKLGLSELKAFVKDKMMSVGDNAYKNESYQNETAESIEDYENFAENHSMLANSLPETQEDSNLSTELVENEDCDGRLTKLSENFNEIMDKFSNNCCVSQEIAVLDETIGKYLDSSVYEVCSISESEKSIEVQNVSQITSAIAKSADKDTSSDDFIRIDKKEFDDQFEFIDDFYDEVCSIE